MIIKSLELNNFRNYSNQAIKLNPNLNVIIGNNAQGKTNLLEAIFIISRTAAPVGAVITPIR